MALVPDQKFSTFQNGGDLQVGDTVVGLRGGINARFIYTGELPPGYIIPVAQGGTGSSTAAGARTNLGLGTMAVQNASGVAITGGTAALASGQVIAAPANATDIVNKSYVDGIDSGNVKSVSGTLNQVNVDNTDPQNPVLSLPQDIASTSTPVFAGFNDANNNAIIRLISSVSAVNYIDIYNAAAGFPPQLVSAGTDSDIALYAVAKGNRPVTLFGAMGGTNAVTVLNGTGYQHVTAFNFANTAASRTLTFPDATGTVALTSDIPAGTPSALTKVDDTNVTVTLGGTPGTALLQPVSLTMGWTGLLGIARGGTGVGSVTTTPTANAFAGWDSSLNFQSNSFVPGYTTTVTAGASTTLTVASEQQQFFTGTMNQTVVMPVTSTLRQGQPYLIVNNSSGIVTVVSSGLNSIIAISPGVRSEITCILTSGTSAASWSADNSAAVAGVASITGTANQITASAATGNVVLSLPANVRISNSILDANNNLSLSIAAVASAVNYVTLTNNAAGSPVQFSAQGADTDIAFNIASKGALEVRLRGGNTTNGIRIYNGTGQQHSTLFSFANTAASRTLTFPDATGTALMTGVAINSVPSIQFSSTDGIIGTTTNNSATPGSVGEAIGAIVAPGSAVSLTPSTTANVTSINVTAGDWDVCGNLTITGTATTAGLCTLGVTTVSATTPTADIVAASATNDVAPGSFAALGARTLSASYARISVATTTTVYLVANCIFSGGTATAYGKIVARRRR